MAGDQESESKIIHYTVGHEVGVAAGFAGVMLLAALAFLLSWRAYNKKEERKEEERKADLAARGFGVLEKGHLNNKNKGRGDEEERKMRERDEDAITSSEETEGESNGRFEAKRDNVHGFGGDGSGERVFAKV